jgi:hypothetical protein
MGDYALASNTTGSLNVALGAGCMDGAVTGGYNVAAGFWALRTNSAGGFNVAAGYRAAYNSQGNSNVALGVDALFTNYSGSNTVAVGDSALFSFNSSTSANVAVGSKAAFSTSTGTYNSAVGQTALYSNSTGSYNTSLGYQASYDNSTGTGNSSLGTFALYGITTGSYNSAIGDAAYPTSSGALTNYTGLGYNVGYGTSISNSVELGNTSVTRIQGQVNLSLYSDARIKERVEADVPGLAFITRLRPVTYNLNIHKQNAILYANKPNQKEWDGKYDIEKMRMTGFIAQEVDSSAQAAGYDFSGVIKPSGPNDLYQVRYSDFVVPLVKAVQEQQNMIDELKKQNEELKRRLDALEKK